MGIVVVKFGGTSVATEEARKEAISHIKSLIAAGKNIIVVVSAMGRKGSPYATDTLISLLRTGSNLSTLDLLMSCGEVISACVFADNLMQQGIDAVALTSSQAGIVTNGIFGSADIFDIDTTLLKKELYEGKVVVVPGFQGVSVRNEITTLGRGGSDTSAVVIGRFMNAESVHIFTDVPGIAIVDPKIVPKAKFMEYVDMHHMYELTRWGAWIIHPRAVKEAKKCNLDLYVRSTFDKGLGTKIVKDMKTTGPVGIGIIKGCNLFEADETDNLIIGKEEKRAVRKTPDDKYSLITVVFGEYGENYIREAIDILPIKTMPFFNQESAHIFVETNRVELLANELYRKLFEKVITLKSNKPEEI
jgi:aspartate kinase